jgi:serine protease Do/serine protease DegQ
MKSKLLSPLLVLAALAAGAAPGLAAAKGSKEAKPAVSAAANKKPELRIDTTPITEGKSSVVTSYADIVEPVQKAVVSIYSTKIVKERVQVNPLFRQFFPGLQDQERESKQEGMGSGVIVTADGYILTNNHVVEGADELKVSLSDDREFIAKVIGTDPKTDVAVIKIESEKLPTVVLADSEKLRVGDIVFAVGNPLGVGQTVTMGIVSAKGRNKVGILDGGYEDFIQTDAAINMGNSGGALVDAKGRLVGINSAILSPSRGNIGIGFAIPVNLAASIMNSLIATGSVSRGYLGVKSPDSVTPDVAEQLGLPKDTRGVLITDIDAGSPAEKAGLKRTDVILGVDGHTVSSLEDLRLRISQMIPGSTTKIKIVRDGKEKLVDVTLGKLTENPNELFAGVNVVPLTNEARRRLGIVDPRISGLVITDIAEESPFRERLATDVVIIEVNRTAVPDLAAARAALKPPGENNLLAVYYRGQIRFAVVTVPKGGK